MENKALCPICGEGNVTDHVDRVEHAYKGQKSMLPLHYQTCDVCTSDFAGAHESKLNKRGMMAFRKSVDGLLTGAEIAALREQYKLTQDQAARLFGGGPVAFSKYENDDVSHSESMDCLLRLARDSGDAFWRLVDIKAMGHELRRPKVAAMAVAMGPDVTNVVAMADFVTSKYRMVATKTVSYPTEEKKWK